MLLVALIIALSVGAFVVVRDRKGGGRVPPDARAARERLVDGGAVCRPLQAVPDDAFGGKVDAPDQMVECTLEREPVRILAWGTTERRKQAMADMAEVVCKLDDDADPAIVTGPLMIQTYGGDPTFEPERKALDHTSALLDAAVTDDLCAEG